MSAPDQNSTQFPYASSEFRGNLKVDGSLKVGDNVGSDNAIAEFLSTTKGILVPRVTTTQRNAIPAGTDRGLLVYDITLSKFYYRDGATWYELGGGGGAAGWGLQGNTGTDPDTDFIGTTDMIPLCFRINNWQSGKLATDNTSFGLFALNSPPTGTDNAAFGSRSLSTVTTGEKNTGIGAEAGSIIESGNNNTAIGYQADMADAATSNAIALGYQAVAASNQFALPDTITTFKLNGIGGVAGSALIKRADGLWEAGYIVYPNTYADDNAAGIGGVPIGRQYTETGTGYVKTRLT